MNLISTQEDSKRHTKSDVSFVDFHP